MKPTNLPLPRRQGDSPRTNIDPGTEGNQGLYFNKFFNQWADGYSEVIKDHSIGRGAQKKTYYNGKMCWLLSQVHGALPDNKQFETSKRAGNGRKFGNANCLTSATARIASLATASDGEARKYTTTGPFLTGMGLEHPVENGFLWHHTLGVPYLPGSSIKGMIRAWARDWEGVSEKEIDRLFGHDATNVGGAAGNIIVFDALPTGPVNLYAEIITPHDGGWRISGEPENNPPADWVSPNPIPFLAVKEGAEFQFALALRGKPTPDDKPGPNEGDLVLAYKHLNEALEWIGAGAKTAVGFGRFKTKEAIEREEREWQENERKRREEKIQIAANMEAENKAKEIEAKEAWQPKVGDPVLYYDENRVISKMADGGDFYVTLPDGSNEMLSDKNECSPLKDE